MIIFIQSENLNVFLAWAKKFCFVYKWREHRLETSEHIYAMGFFYYRIEWKKQIKMFYLTISLEKSLFF